jgi:osmotically-inducible protein OsmY
VREDHSLQAAVLDRLDMDPAINSSHIGVAARDGVVTLSGHVPSLFERVEAEKVAGSVRGVRAIVNLMSVELGGVSQTSDERLAQQAYSRLASNSSVPEDRLHLAVNNGVVTLHGDVDWPFQLDAALKDLQRLGAIRELHSDVVVRPPVKPERVQEKIRDAFAQLAPLDAERIFATAEGSEVTLAGEVTSWHEKGLAESVAWSVPGVSRVINNILVI